MTERVDFVKSEIVKIYNKLNDTYVFVDNKNNNAVTRLDNDTRFFKINALLMELTNISNNLKQVARGVSIN